jgi:hypothetical protein
MFQSFHEDFGALFFLESGGGCLADQNDVGDDDILKRFDILHQSGNIFKIIVHTGILVVWLESVGTFFLH